MRGGDQCGDAQTAQLKLTISTLSAGSVVRSVFHIRSKQWNKASAQRYRILHPLSNLHRSLQAMGGYSNVACRLVSYHMGCCSSFSLASKFSLHDSSAPMDF